MSYVESIQLLVDDLRAMKPSGAMALASLLEIPRQTVYAWPQSVTRERTAKAILLNIEETARAKGALDILTAVRARLAPDTQHQGESHA